MNTSRERMERIISEYLESTFVFNTVVDITENSCYGLRESRQEIGDFTLDELRLRASKIVHPLFANRLQNELDIENLSNAYDNMRLIRFDILMKDSLDGEYHWYRVRLTPIADGSGHKIFFFNALPCDNMMERTERSRTEVFNETVLKQLLYNHILVYVIDLSNDMSRLVYSTNKQDYKEYANRFANHKEMMNDLLSNYVSEDFLASVSKYNDYEYIRSQLETKERLVLIFRDKKNQAFEINVTKYPEYSDTDYPMVIFAIKEIS